MKIEESQVQLDSRHEFRRFHEMTTESRTSFRTVLQNASPILPQQRASSQETAEKCQARVRWVLQQLVETMLAMLAGGGQKCPCSNPTMASVAPTDAIADTDLPVLRFMPAAPDRQTTAVRLRVLDSVVTRRERVEEFEQTEFSGSGTIRTADGRNVSFKIDFQMQRTFAASMEFTEQKEIALKDPLVLNFSGTAAQLAGQRMDFDIDADGTLDSLPTLCAGSGYLVLDADHDGKVADGRDLFGATGTHAGDGFGDLARLDADTNGWIDEADPAWTSLAIWFPDGKIKTLAASGVGAISLSSADTPFALKDDHNDPLGQIWQTGVFLKENGEAGTVQQIDLAAAPKPSQQSAAEDPASTEKS